MLYPNPLLPTPRHTPCPGALRCRRCTYLKSQSTGSGPTASDRRAQTTSASRNLCGCGSKASTPSPPASPSAPGPSLLVRVVLAGGLGTRKPIGPRACHISWVESWENNHRDRRPGAIGTGTVWLGSEIGPPRLLLFLPDYEIRKVHSVQKNLEE